MSDISFRYQFNNLWLNKKLLMTLKFSGWKFQILFWKYTKFGPLFYLGIIGVGTYTCEKFKFYHKYDIDMLMHFRLIHTES